MQIKFYLILFVSVLFLNLCFCYSSNASDPLIIYSGLKNKDFIRSGFHERLYGVWRFEIDTEHLIIKGLEWNGWSGTVFGKHSSPRYRWQLWNKQFKVNDIEKIISALEKVISWADTAKKNNVKDYKKELINLGQGISVYFSVSKSGEYSAIFKNEKWIFKDRIRDGGYKDRYIELALPTDNSDHRLDSVADMVNSLKKYKIMHQNYVEKENARKILEQNKIESDKKEKEQIDQLFK